MRRLLAFLASTLLIWGCEELFPTEKPMISLDSDQAKSVTVSEDGGSFDVVFTSALSWTAEIVYSDGADGWASLNKTSGEGGYNIAKIKVAVQKNESGEERSAKLVIKSDTVSEEITFTQPAAEVNPGPGPGPEPAVFELTEGSAEIGAEGGKIRVAVQYNVDYKITVPVDWIREVETKSYDEKVHTFEVAPNLSSEPRSATISFCGNAQCVPYTINQAGAEVSVRLDVDVKSISVPADGLETPYVVNVMADTEWMVDSDSDWCIVTPSSGSNNGSFSVSIGSNTSESVRIANVEVSAVDGSVCRTISVIQTLVSSVSGDDWTKERFYHRSLALRFTADWCGYCPQMATAMSNAQQELQGRLEVISVHGSGSGLACDESNVIAGHYPVAGYPTGLIDCRTYVVNDDIPVTTSRIVAAVKDTEDTYDTLTGTSWTSSVSGSQVALILDTYIKKAGTYKVTALLVEDKFVAYQSGASESYEHNGIIREAFSDPLGEPFEVSEDGMIKNFTYVATVPSVCNLNNMRVVVYIQRLNTLINSYYVDNAASMAVGKDKPLDVISSGVWGNGNEGIVPGDDINL